MNPPTKGILFRAPMVLALLNTKPGVWPGQPVDPSKPFKWQTRRTVKPQPEYQGRESFGDSWKWSKGKDWFAGVTTKQLVGDKGLCHKSRMSYHVGDLLYVKETWKPNDQANLGGSAVFYRADDGASTMNDWKPSIYMPRWASRIWLEVKSVRVQRVNEILEEDAKAEGIDGRWHPDQAGLWTWRDYRTPGRFAYGTMFKANHSYATLWDSINGKGSFDKGPWVWVYELARVK